MRRFADRGPGEVAVYAATLAVAFLVFSAALGVYLGWDAPLLLGLVIGSAAGVLATILLVWDYNRLLWKIEEWSKGAIELTGDDISGKPPAQPRSVPRPFPVTQGRQHANRTAPAQEPLMRAPSGRDVTMHDLLEFAKLAPRVKPTYQGYWKQHWEHEYWGDIMDIWAIFECVEPRQERHTSRWLAETYEEAARLLATAYSDRPTP